MASTLPRTYLTGDPQVIGIASGATVTLSMQAIRTPQEAAKPLVGAVVRAAVVVLEPTLAFGVQLQEGQDDLGYLTAELQIDVYDTQGITPAYTVVRNVTGDLLLTRGTVTFAPADYFCFVAKLALTNRKTTAVTAQVSRRTWGVEGL